MSSRGSRDVQKGPRDVQAPWHSGSLCNVYWNESYEKVFVRKGKPDDQAKIEATMRRMYCEHDHRNISEKKFKSQRAISVSGTKTMVWEFKSFQLRVYGVQGSVNKKKTFFATEVVPDKRDDKADPNVLKRAAEKGIDFAASIKAGKL